MLAFQASDRGRPAREQSGGQSAPRSVVRREEEGKWEWPQKHREASLQGALSTKPLTQSGHWQYELLVEMPPILYFFVWFGLFVSSSWLRFRKQMFNLLFLELLISIIKSSERVLEGLQPSSWIKLYLCVGNVFPSDYFNYHLDGL